MRSFSIYECHPIKKLIVNEKYWAMILKINTVYFFTLQKYKIFVLTFFYVQKCKYKNAVQFTIEELFE